MLAVKRFTTFSTNSNLRVTATIHEDNRLVTTRNAIRKRFAQCRRHEHAFLLAHLAHINHFHFGERSRSRTVLERQQFEVPCLCIAERFKARRCRAKHYKRPILLRQMESQVTRMVTRSRILLLKRRIMFFVQNNNIKIKRRKNGAARPKHHFCRAI